MADITAAFKLSCKGSHTSELADYSALAPETMIKAPATALLDAMNALAMFDPALDTGLAPPPESFNPGQEFSGAEICDIMDRLIHLEVRTSP
jgi:hypothetical protein